MAGQIHALERHTTHLPVKQLSAEAAVSAPFIALCCDRLGRKPMMVLGQIANLVAVLSLLAVDVLGISLYIYFCLSIVVASFCGQAGV